MEIVVLQFPEGLEKARRPDNRPAVTTLVIEHDHAQCFTEVVAEATLELSQSQIDVTPRCFRVELIHAGAAFCAFARTDAVEEQHPRAAVQFCLEAGTMEAGRHIP